MYGWSPKWMLPHTSSWHALTDPTQTYLRRVYPAQDTGHVVMWVIHVVLKKYFWYIAEHNGVSLIFDLLRITEKGELEMINIKRELFPVWREDSVIKHFIVLRSILKGESVFTGEGGDSHSYNIDERITQCWFYRNTFGVGTGIYLIMSLYLQVGMSFMFEFNMSLT